MRWVERLGPADAAIAASVSLYVAWSLGRRVPGAVADGPSLSLWAIGMGTLGSLAATCAAVVLLVARVRSPPGGSPTAAP